MQQGKLSRKRGCNGISSFLLQRCWRARLGSSPGRCHKISCKSEKCAFQMQFDEIRRKREKERELENRQCVQQKKASRNFIDRERGLHRQICNSDFASSKSIILIS